MEEIPSSASRPPRNRRGRSSSSWRESSWRPRSSPPHALLPNNPAAPAPAPYVCASLPAAERSSSQHHLDRNSENSRRAVSPNRYTREFLDDRFSSGLAESSWRPRPNLPDAVLRNNPATYMSTSLPPAERSSSQQHLDRNSENSRRAVSPNRYTRELLDDRLSSGLAEVRPVHTKEQMPSQDHWRVDEFSMRDHESNSSQDVRNLDSEGFREENRRTRPGFPVVDRRRQWRPATQADRANMDSGERPLRGTTHVDRGNVDSGQRRIPRRRPPATRNAVVSGEVIEASRVAVEGALEGLSIRRDQGDVTSGGIRDCNRPREVSKPRAQNRGSRCVSGSEFLSEGVEPTTSAMHKVLKDKTNVPQLVQELEEKLRRGQVECMICYDTIKREAPVWSCGGCYSIFHISCIRKWARAPISADFSLSTSSEVTVGNWRCPGCQSPQFIAADELRYKCFCGQNLEPQVDYYITPHSCGGPCKKPLSFRRNTYCNHLCTMQCHPGPCPPCNALAPPQLCPCGKSSHARRCSELKSAKSCGQLCGHQLQCGRHYCANICHEDPCGICNAILTVKCFCGRKTEARPCGSMGLQGELEWEKGVLSCGHPCPHKLQCGRHSCNRRCHPGQCGDCELSPGKVQTCPCGKTLIKELLGVGKHRASCADPVPLCGRSCEKLLPCGKHACKSFCHVGACPPCNVLVEQKCRCNSSTQIAPCYKTLNLEDNGHAIAAEVQNDEGLFLCNRMCGNKKNCGRHRCSYKCCLLLKNDSSLFLGENNPHLCLLSCGKKLRCGQHTCQELCHNGHCPPCLESTFTELSCACGKTAIPPPVPCGTPPPSCPHPCSIPQPCGHLSTHTCHFGECPPCTVPTAKECVGNHVILRNVPCGSRDIKCNKLCGKVRQCGLHACGRTCHLPPCDMPSGNGDSRTLARSCGQECGAPRRDCQHICVAPCHPSAPCPETTCKFLVTITCSCGRLSEQVSCDAGEAVAGSDAFYLAYHPNLMLQRVEGKTRVPLGQRKLACVEECAKLEKKRVLADAFGITTAAVDPAISAESVQASSEALRDLVRKEPQWILAVEERFKFLVLGTKSPSPGSIRVHVFCSLPQEKREVLRQIAERWNLSVNAVGREPRRFLTAHVNPKSRPPAAHNCIGRSPLPVPGQARPAVFNPYVDMDPRLIVGLFDLPRDADISTLVLRFGGECELVWLNDKNALAVFTDMARAATAIRRVDHASVYSGASRISLPASGSNMRGWSSSEGGRSAGVSRKKNNQESSWIADAWEEEWGRSSGQPMAVWHGRGIAITTSQNPWGALEQVEAQTGNPDAPALNVDKATSSKDDFSVNATSGIYDSGTSTPMVDVENWEELDD